jgi:hypothetical protein
MSRTGSVKAGITSLTSQAGSLSGQMVKAVSRGLGRSATTALALSNSFEGPKTLDALTPLAAVGALLSGDGRTRLKILNILTAAQVTKAAATGIGTGIARLSRPKDEAIRTDSYFQGKPLMRAWPSRLTPALNARDIMGQSRLSVAFSGGQIVESGGKSWHVGTTVIKMPQDELRTITHLQSMALPSSHYYFDRPLKDREVAGIVLGQKGFEPKHVPGFVGQVSELESLHPGLAGLKKGLVRAQLFWGPNSRDKALRRKDAKQNVE